MTLSVFRSEVVAVDQQVWRVGYLPQPWAWPSWQYSTDGRFPGRWDDRNGNFRTMYAGASLLGCLLEVLAAFRPDTSLAAALGEIEHNSRDSPTAPAGSVPITWLEPRAAATAQLTGHYYPITGSRALAALRPVFLDLARQLGLADFDAAALKDGRPRVLTQAVATHLYETTLVDGVQFSSRLGDEHLLWAIFEQPQDEEISRQLVDCSTMQLTHEDPDLQEAFTVLGLHWAS